MQDYTEVLRLLFISKVRIKALRFFFLNPKTEIHLRAAVREFEEEINAVRRELTRLAEIEVLHASKRGNKIFYKLNQDNLIFEDLLAIVHKVFGVGGAIIRNTKKLGDIKFAILAEPFLRGESPDAQRIDLMLVGSLDLNNLEKLMATVEKELGKEVNYTVMSDREFSLKRKRRDPFVVEMILSKHILLVGDYKELIS